MPAGDAGETIKRFAQQANRDVMFPAEPVNGISTPAIKGEFTVREALDRLLAGTPLRATEDGKTGALAIVRTAPAGSRHPPELLPVLSSGEKATGSHVKTHKTLLGGLVAMFSPAGTANPKGQIGAQASQGTSTSGSSGDVVELPQFNVSETPANPYHPTDTQSVTRVAGDILSSPFSVNVITAEMLNDIGADAVFAATRYFPGVSPGRGTGTGGFEDRQDFRGFENLGKTIDSFSGTILSTTGQGIMADVDPAFVERAELVMGPDTILSPTGAPGGSVNIITKSPKFDPGGYVSVEVGNYDAQKLILDDYGPIGSGRRVAYRVIGSFQDAKTYEPGHVRQSNAEAALEYDFSSQARIVAKVIFEKWALEGNVANANDNGMQVYAPDTIGGAVLSNAPQPGFQYNGWNASASWSIRPDTVYLYDVVFTAALTEHINMRLGGSLLDDEPGAQSSSFYSVVPSETFNAATGQVTGVTQVNPAAIPVLGYWAIQRSHSVQFQNDFAASYHLGSVSIQPVIGWASQMAANPLFVSVLDKNLPTVNLQANNTLPYAPPLSQFTSFSYNTPSFVRLFQAYGVIRAGFFNDRVFLTAGGSRTWIKEDVYVFGGDYISGGDYVGAAPGGSNYLEHYTLGFTGNPLAPTQAPFRDTYLAGLLVRPTNNVSLYGSFSSNSALAISNNPLWSTGTQFEFGAKSEFFNQRVMLSAAHFQIIQSNVSSVNPLFNTGQSTQPNILSDMTNHGLELNVTGGVTRQLSLVGSFTDMRMRDNFGRRIRNVPDTMANLLANYSCKSGPLANLNVFVGVSHLGNVAGETESGVTAEGVPEQPGFYLAPWTVVNAGVNYKLGRYRAALNVDNVANAKFWWQPSSRISVSPYPGITFRLTTTMHF